MSREQREIWTEEQREAYRKEHPVEERIAAREAYWKKIFDEEFEKAQLKEKQLKDLISAQPINTPSRCFIAPL